MAPKHNKMNLLAKRGAETTDAICEGLLSAEDLKKDVKAILNRNITLEHAESARDAAIDCLKEGMEKKLPELYEGEEVEKSLDELVDIIKSAPKDKKKQTEGWRPGGSIRDEIYPHARPTHLAHIERLKAAKEDLERQCEEEERALQSEAKKQKQAKGRSNAD